MPKQGILLSWCAHVKAINVILCSWTDSVCQNFTKALLLNVVNTEDTIFKNVLRAHNIRQDLAKVSL